jgi:hypothetical protein
MCKKQEQQGRMGNVHKTGSTRKDGYCAQNRDKKEECGKMHKTGTTIKDG